MTGTTSPAPLPPEGLPVTLFAQRPGVRSAETLRRAHGDAFLVQHAQPRSAPTGPMRTRDMHADDEHTGEVVFLIFAVRRQEASAHAFVSVGRIPGNDVILRDETVSKFHAFFREGPGLVLQDGRSRNGTFVDDEPVPPRGAGPGVAVAAGRVLRFGSVSCVLLDAKGVSDLVTRLAPAR